MTKARSDPLAASTHVREAILRRAVINGRRFGAELLDQALDALQAHERLVHEAVAASGVQRGRRLIELHLQEQRSSARQLLRQRLDPYLGPVGHRNRGAGSAGSADHPAVRSPPRWRTRPHHWG
jgi:hypothetical protein